MSSGAKFKDVRSQYEILFKEAPPPWENEETTKEGIRSAYESSTARIVNSHSAPSQGLNALASTPRLPRAQNPTITLLQKARGQHFRNRNFSISVHSAKARIKIKKRHYAWRIITISLAEGQLPRGAAYLEESESANNRLSSDERPLISPGEISKLHPEIS